VRAFSARRRTQAAWSAAIAQLVEHVIRNDGVTGSNPVCGTSKTKHLGKIRGSAQSRVSALCRQTDCRAGHTALDRWIVLGVARAWALAYSALSWSRSASMGGE
jgi:hypothetical protein